MTTQLKSLWVERILYFGKYSRLCGEFLLASFCRIRQKSKTPSDRIFWHFLGKNRSNNTQYMKSCCISVSLKAWRQETQEIAPVLTITRKFQTFICFNFLQGSQAQKEWLKRKRGKLGDNFPRLEICSEAALPPSTKSFRWVFFSDCKKSRAFLWPTSLSVFTSPGANGIKLPLMAIYEMHFAEV